MLKMPGGPCASVPSQVRQQLLRREEVIHVCLERGKKTHLDCSLQSSHTQVTVGAADRTVGAVGICVPFELFVFAVIESDAVISTNIDTYHGPGRWDWACTYTSTLHTR